MDTNVDLSKVSATALISELIRRGGEYVEGEDYGLTQILIRKKYTAERSEKKARKVLILDHLDFK
ncbi:hypothetical protein [Peptoniphilus sp. HCN-40583]|uniref:hypothetical protein n=1 Tax=Peptoniphilus sp. HCN-40583 TaxID=3134662 RepID=UPI0030BFB227